MSVPVLTTGTFARWAGAVRGLINHVAKARSLFSSLVELSGLCAIVYGVSLVSRPAGFVVGGLLAVAASFALERRPRRA